MPDANGLAPAIDALIFEVFRLNGALTTAGDTITGGLGLSSARWQVMGAIARSGGATVAELARRIGLTRQSVQRVVTELVNEGYVELFDNPRHRRARTAGLTELGWRSLDAITEKWKPIAEELSERFGRDRLGDTARLLADLRDAFRRVASEADNPSNETPLADSKSNATIAARDIQGHGTGDASGAMGNNRQ